MVPGPGVPTHPRGVFAPENHLLLDPGGVRSRLGSRCRTRRTTSLKKRSQDWRRWCRRVSSSTPHNRGGAGLAVAP